MNYGRSLFHVVKLLKCPNAINHPLGLKLYAFNFILLHLSFKHMDQHLPTARELFNRSPFDESKCKKLQTWGKDKNAPIIKGYYAASLAIGCKYISNPFIRMGPFKEAKQLLEELISENFDEVELRYIRYAIQRQAPKILGYYKNIAGDMQVLLNYIKAEPNSDLTQHMMIYLKDTKDPILEQL